MNEDCKAKVSVLSSEVVEGVMTELTLQAEIAVLSQRLATPPSRPSWQQKRENDTSLQNQSRMAKTGLESESLRNSLDMAESKSIRAFDSMAGKTFEQPNEEVFIEVNHFDQYLDNLDRQTEQFLKLSAVLAFDAKSQSLGSYFSRDSSSYQTGNSKCLEQVDRLQDAGQNIHNTIGQLK